MNATVWKSKFIQSYGRKTDDLLRLSLQAEGKGVSAPHVILHSKERIKPGIAELKR
jgi:hypothetical protein